MRLFKQSQPQLDRYRQLRAAGQQLVSKLYEAAKGPQYDIIKTAKKLTLTVHDRTVVFDGETDTNALADFYFHEMRFGGKRIIDALADSSADLTPDQRDLLTAYRDSRCSLFAIVGVDRVACQIKLDDLLEPNRSEIALTDISLSRSVEPRTAGLLFTRAVHCDGINLSAGLFFAFPSVHRAHLLTAYEARILTVEEKERSQRRFIFFYQKNREFGIAQAYQDVV